MDRLELQIARRAMACDFSLVFPATVQDPVAAGCAALDEVERLESLLSAYNERSELCRINREAQRGPVAANPEVYSLLRVSSGISAATGGAFDPAAGALVKHGASSAAPAGSLPNPNLRRRAPLPAATLWNLTVPAKR
jgi:thiamine biosynthesis lipoprotein